MLQGGLISVNVTWVPQPAFFVSLDNTSKNAIESHIKDGKAAGTIIQGGYTINWKKLS